MRITKIAVAGTLESSDVLIRVAPSSKIEIELHSSVFEQFSDDILKTINDVLAQFNIEAVQLVVEDKGALDCVLRARLKAALLRATDETVNWGNVL